MEEDTKSANDILRTLNGGEVQGDWEMADGYHVMTVVTFSSNGDPTFEPGKGMPVKNFVNRKTGEVRSFYFRQVLKDKNG